MVTSVSKTMEDWEDDEARRAPKVGHLWQVPAETRDLEEDRETDEPRGVPQPRRSSHLIIGVAGI